MRGSYDIQSIYSHEETGNMITYQRDISISEYLRSRSVPWHEYATNGVVRKLATRDDWSKIWSSRMSAEIIPRPEDEPEKVFNTAVESDAWRSTQVRNPSIQKC